jgi:hypothetical protein
MFKIVHNTECPFVKGRHDQNTNCAYIITHMTGNMLFLFEANELSNSESPVLPFDKGNQ